MSPVDGNTVASEICFLGEIQTRPPASVREMEISSPDKNASSVVEWEQDGVKDSSTVLLGSCTRGWRRRARSRRNYFLFSDPEREVDCLTGCSSRPCPSAHVCVRESVRITFCSDGLIHGKCRNCLTMFFPLMLHNHRMFLSNLPKACIYNAYSSETWHYIIVCLISPPSGQRVCYMFLFIYLLISIFPPHFVGFTLQYFFSFF